MTLEAGQTLSHYRLLEKIGEGGMGVVWKAVDTTLDREVAIKILPESVSQQPDRLARFEREAKMLASLNHPGIAAVHSVHESDGTRFLSMELVPGEDLRERLKRGALPIEEALDIARQVAEALEAAHERGVVHRDLKPANVKLTPEDRAKVLDLGLAKAMSPDASPSGEVDPAPLNVQSWQALSGSSLGAPGVPIGVRSTRNCRSTRRVKEKARRKNAEPSTFLALSLHVIFIRAEERALEDKFGDRWQTYKRQVRRWI